MSQAEETRPLSTQRAYRLDEWENAVTNLGTPRDKSTYTRYIRRVAKDDGELEALFDFDDMAYVIASAEPEAALRKGVDIRLETPDATTRLHDQMDMLGFTPSLLDALIWEGVYGGAALFIGADDGQAPELPLNIANVKSVPFIIPIDRRDLTPHTYYDKLLTPKYGRPEVYRMLGTHRTEGGGAVAPTVYVHETRLVLFRGGRCSNTLRRERQGWGASKIDRAYRALQIFADNWANVSHIMHDAAQGVFSIKGLIEMLGGPMKDVALERMRQIDRQRSNARALILDDETENFRRESTNMAELPALLDRTAHRLAAAARMPVSILMGREPSGLNATGEADIRSWYDNVQSRQTHDLVPKIMRVVQILTSAQDGPTGGVLAKEIAITFPPPWTATPGERADIELKHAQTDQIRIASTVLTPPEVAIARYRPEGYQDTINPDMARAEADLEADLEAAKRGDEPPPAPVVPDDSPEAAGAGTAPAPAPAAAQSEAAPVPEEAKDPSTALNGAQVSSLMEIVQSVAARTIPRETGLELIMAAFPIDRPTAERLMGEVGRSFFVATEAPSGQP